MNRFKWIDRCGCRPTLQKPICLQVSILSRVRGCDQRLNSMMGNFVEHFKDSHQGKGKAGNKRSELVLPHGHQAYTANVSGLKTI